MKSNGFKAFYFLRRISATAFDPEVVNGIFNISCIIPIVGLVAVAAALAFIYPLNKKRVEENVIELKKRRGEI